MNGQHIAAMVIRACLLGLCEGSFNVDEKNKYIHTLTRLAEELEKTAPYAHPGANPPIPENPQPVGPSELEMYRADHQALQQHGFHDSGELLAAYKHLAEQENAARRRIDELVVMLNERDNKLKPWTDAEITRVWRNCPELYRDVSTLRGSEANRAAHRGVPRYRAKMTFYAWDGSPISAEEVWDRFIKHYAQVNGFVDRQGNSTVQSLIGGIEGLRKAFIEAQDKE